MVPRINVITLGVEDLKRSRIFYENLGFSPSSISNEHMAAFQAKNLVFCLYPHWLLAEDALVELKREGFRGITLAHNVTNKNDVQDVLEEASLAGAKIVKPAQDTFWGGHSGYFADPDGHLWEVAWNPHWLIGEDGMVHLPQ
jgi:hypothetical protein